LHAKCGIGERISDVSDRDLETVIDYQGGSVM
jgi:hypothetical protein